MVCPNCGKATDNAERYCRACGADFLSLSITPQNVSLQNKDAGSQIAGRGKDPDELMGNGIGAAIVGDGFLMVGIILSAVESSVNSMLWLLLLIPAFILYGKGFADILHARQIRRRLQEQKAVELPSPEASQRSITAAFQKHGSDELSMRPSVTDRTTRQLR